MDNGQYYVKIGIRIADDRGECRNIRCGVVEKDSTIRNFWIVQNKSSRQVTRDTKYYNLQMIIAVGINVKNGGTEQQKRQSSSLHSHEWLEFIDLVKNRLGQKLN